MLHGRSFLAHRWGHPAHGGLLPVISVLQILLQSALLLHTIWCKFSQQLFNANVTSLPKTVLHVMATARTPCSPVEHNMDRNSRVHILNRNDSAHKETNNPLVHTFRHQDPIGAAGWTHVVNVPHKQVVRDGSKHSCSNIKQHLVTAFVSILCSLTVSSMFWWASHEQCAAQASSVEKAVSQTKQPAYVQATAGMSTPAQVKALAADTSLDWQTQLLAGALADVRLELAANLSDHRNQLTNLFSTQEVISAQIQNVSNVLQAFNLKHIKSVESLDAQIATEAADRRATLQALSSQVQASFAQLEHLRLESIQHAAAFNVSQHNLETSIVFINSTVCKNIQNQEALGTVVQSHTASIQGLVDQSASIRYLAQKANSTASAAQEESASAIAAVNAANINSPLLQGATEEVQSLKYMVAELGQHAIIADERDESFLRSTGGSGVTTARGIGSGSNPFHSSSWADYYLAFLTCHDHADLRDTIGMGEFEAVMNGVNFKTRHNDYRLRRPSTTSSAMKRTAEVELPSVPPSVLAHGSNVTAQIIEMKEYFRAWANQDESIRDYKPYFKPVLSYVEGWWGVDSNFEEPFDSDRHKVAADSWGELYDRVRLLEQHGWKDRGENVPWLPSKMWGLKDGVAPQLARWNYRILAIPLKEDIELSRFIVEPDSQMQLAFTQPQTRDNIFKTRAARFKLNNYIGSYKNHILKEPYGRRQYSFIDDLMAQVPGLDNDVPDAPFHDDIVYDPRLGNETAFEYSDRSRKLNSRFYNRYFSVSTKGAMGESRRRRGWNDDHLWVATTSQESVAALRGADGRLDRKSYALPLEIIFTTPLTAWNPYNLTIHPDDTNGIPKLNGRNGSLTNPRYAYDGVERRNYYLTPVEFFGDLSSDSPADTSVTPVGVISDADRGTPREGTVYKVAASGHWIHFPNIPGVEQTVPATSSRIRQRYPIAPARPTSKTLWQEIKALQAITSDGDSWKVNTGLQPFQTNYRHFEVGASVSTGFHTHRFHLTGDELDLLANNGTVSRTTQQGNMHQHSIKVQLDTSPSADPAAPYRIVECDGNPGALCAPGHDHSGVHRSTY